MTQSPEEIRAKLRELGYLQNPLDRFVFGAGRLRGAVSLALGAGGRGALLAGPLIGLFSIVLLGKELAPDERLSWFLALSALAALIVFLWVVAQALALHALARLRGRAHEALPAVAVILSGITFLLPTLLWLLASRHIQSSALRERNIGALIFASCLMLAASATIFIAARAADVLALSRIEALGLRSRGWRSLALGAFLLLASTVFFNGNAARDIDRWHEVESKYDRLRGFSGGFEIHSTLLIVAVDGAHGGEIASALGDKRMKLCSFAADTNLISGWMKIQSGRTDWQAHSFTSLKPIWGGNVKSPGSAPGRLLAILNPLGLSRVAPGRAEKIRPPFFWEIARGWDRVIGGWNTYPSSPHDPPGLISDRLDLLLVQSGDAHSLSLGSYPGFSNDPRKIWADLRDTSAGLKLDQFHRTLAEEWYPIASFRTGEEFLTWLYLPGMDIVCPSSDDKCELARRRTFEFIAGRVSSPLYAYPEAILLIENPGRRGGTGAIWFRPAKDETIRPIHAPEEVAAAVLDYLGYPLAADLAGVKSEEAKIPTYGTVTLEDPGDASDDATLKALKQLGYIQ